MSNNFIVEERCLYCSYMNWLPVGLTNPAKLIKCDDCGFVFPLNHNSKNYELIAKYYLM